MTCSLCLTRTSTPVGWTWAVHLVVAPDGTPVGAVVRWMCPACEAVGGGGR